MVPWHSSYFDLNKYILHCSPKKYLHFRFRCSLSVLDNNLSATYSTSLCSDTHVHVLAHAKSVRMNTHTYAPPHTHTHFDPHTRCPCTHSPDTPNNCWDKSLWDLPPCLQTASHTVPIHLSLDTQQCKNIMAALKKAPGERRHGSRKHFCLFLMGHPHKPGRGYLSQIHGEKTFK